MSPPDPVSSGSSTDLPTPTDPPAVNPTPSPAPAAPPPATGAAASPTACSPEGAARGSASNFCAASRADAHLQAIGLDFNFGESWWLNGYDHIVGGRSVFFGPEEATGNVRLNFHWGVGGLDLFNSFNYANSTTPGLSSIPGLSAPGLSGVTINRFDFEMGFTNYRGYIPIAGRRGSGGAYFGLTGVSRAGLGFGAAFLSGGSPDQPHSGMFQLRPISDGDHLTAGYGNFELGVRLFETSNAFTFGGENIRGCSGYHCSESDYFPTANMRGPVFSLRYYINPPFTPDVPPATMDNAEMAFRLTDLSTGRLNSLMRSARGGDIINSMGVLQAWPLGHDASQAQYSTALTGLFLYSLINGAGAGSDASTLEDSLRRSGSGQLPWIIGHEGAWLLASIIGFAARPGYPSPDAFARGEAGAFDSRYGNAFRMMMPRQIMTDGLGTLGAVGAFGRPGDAWFHIANSILTAGGLGLVLFARPISGNGTPPSSDVPGRPQSWLPYSLLGDYSGTFEGERSVDLYRWHGGANFYDAKQNEMIVSEIGSALIGYSISRWLRPAPASGGSTGSSSSARPSSAASAVPRLNLSLSAGPQQFYLGASGEF